MPRSRRNTRQKWFASANPQARATSPSLPDVPVNRASAAARRSLATHVRRGTRIRPRKTRGAARLRTKTVVEMKRDRQRSRAIAAASDKGHV